MAAITATDIQTKRDAIMRANLRVTVLVAKPEAIDDATAGVFLVKDPDPGDAAVTTATVQGNAKGGNAGGYSWKAYSYADLATAYGI
jgi:hypothetical protein